MPHPNQTNHYIWGGGATVDILTSVRAKPSMHKVVHAHILKDIWFVFVLFAFSDITAHDFDCAWMKKKKLQPSN